MYILLLPIRYLTSKIMPLLAAIAVLLCTAMVLTVWSVMGGFLDMLIGSGRTMTGDIVISWPNAGFPHYEELIERLEKDPEVEAAAPLVVSYGMIGLPNGRPATVEIRGVDGPSFARVTRYADILWWKPVDGPLPKDTDRRDLRLRPLRSPSPSWQQIYDNGLNLSRLNPATGDSEGAIVMGITVSGLNYVSPTGIFEPQFVNRRLSNGDVVTVEKDDIPLFMPLNGDVTLTVLPLDSTGRPVEAESLIVPVANEFHSGQFDLDNKVALVHLDVLQKMLKLNESERVVDDPDNPAGRVEGTNPAKVTQILVRGKGDYSKLGAAKSLKTRVENIYFEFAAAHSDVPRAGEILIWTWEDLNATFIAAVQKETSLVLFLFSMISLVSVILVLSIFWAMISEKTKDIGILRALGASRSGVASVWLAYGLVIGVVGTILGVAAAIAIVWNINPIHEWLGQALGITIWDPAIYYFTVIPNKVEPLHAAIVGAGGIISCFVGAIIPAARAASMHPVRALRFE
jgi:lipoprotein-releasing system permease protein